jgi:hypothetical protein
MISWRKSIHQRGRKLCRCRRGASLSVFFAGTLQLRQPESQAAFRSSRYNHCHPRGFTLSLALLSVWEGLWEDEDESIREPLPDERCRGVRESSPGLWTRQVPRRGWPSWAQAHRIGSSKATESPKAGGAELERFCVRRAGQTVRVGGVVARRRGCSCSCSCDRHDAEPGEGGRAICFVPPMHACSATAIQCHDFRLLAWLENHGFCVARHRAWMKHVLRLLLN